MSMPSSVIRPRHGRSAPAIVISSVLLPAPFAPISATVSPPARSRLTPNRAWKSRYPASRSCTVQRGHATAPPR